MAGPLPHTNQIQAMMEEYLGDAQGAIDESFALLKGSEHFRGIYRVSLATDAVFSKLSTRSIRPSLTAARSIVLRIPLLVAFGQVSVAIIELRRFVEIVFWCLYFSDHRVEWGSFQKSAGKGRARTMDDPIDYCAHRTMAFYINYARERMSGEASRIAVRAVNDLRQAQERLNAVVHPGAMASSPEKAPPFDDLSADVLVQFRNLQRRVFSRCCLVMAAFCRNRFDRLPSMHRAHFDWLVGAPLAKQIRSGPFGLPD